MQKVALTKVSGALDAKVRANVKAQAVQALRIGELSFQENQRGDLYVQIAVDEYTDTPIYAKVELSISTLDLPNLVKAVKGKKNKEPETVEIPSLF